MNPESYTPNSQLQIGAINEQAQAHLEWVRKQKPTQRDGYWRGYPNPHSVFTERTPDDEL